MIASQKEAMEITRQCPPNFGIKYHFSMACNFGAATTLSSNPSSFPGVFLIPKHTHISNFSFSCSSSSSSLLRAAAQSEASESGFTEENQSAFSGLSSSAQTQLDLLEQLSSSGPSIDGYESDGSSEKLTIRDQLAQLVGGRDDDFSIPLGKNLKKVSPKFLTTPQKRNIKRQAYLNEVSQRNDSVFFATIGAFILFPPLVILGIAIITGYVQLLP